MAATVANREFSRGAASSGAGEVGTAISRSAVRDVAKSQMLLTYLTRISTPFLKKTKGVPSLTTRHAL